ncbi:MAG TPA: 23S rRNA (guanosine(2251)-2'-O)-methyltransferase RlmB [Alphaproteobacteria bacterium]|nr:23S rRNA (guanosine(2251)-2'-O)-methyltransferase RlmB [Alphaproteobacteria bacterium]
MTKRKRHGRPSEGAKTPAKSTFSAPSGRPQKGPKAAAKPAARPAVGLRGTRPAEPRDRAPVPAQAIVKSNKPQRGHWLYGLHAVQAALENPRRKVLRLLLTEEAVSAIGGNRSSFKEMYPQAAVETATREMISQMLPAHAVHQGAAMLADPLPDMALEDVLDEIAEENSAVVLILDQVTDPQNVGAILRSAAAFDVAAVVVPDRHSPPETTALAKAASGAIEMVPLIRVVNLARALEQLKQAGFWTAGLAGEAQQTLAAARLSGKVALVLGAEGEGLRRLTRDHCDILVKLPISPRMESLNVSAAAAVALYELARGKS